MKVNDILDKTCEVCGENCGFSYKVCDEQYGTASISIYKNLQLVGYLEIIHKKEYKEDAKVMFSDQSEVETHFLKVDESIFKESDELLLEDLIEFINL